jgi:hypothetical protein
MAHPGLQIAAQEGNVEHLEQPHRELVVLAL